MKILFSSVLIFFYGSLSLAGGKGTISGNLRDAETKQALIAANIIIVNSGIGATTDEKGNFEITGISPGTYSVKFSYLGYESKIATDVVVRPDRITFLNEELFPGGVTTDSVVVSSGYFEVSKAQSISATNFSYEEIRRAPGSAGDVSRIFLGLASVAKVNDQSNSLIVRGGSPTENAFFLDNIEVPNINHFPSQANSGGPIGLLNIDFVKNVNFFTGGFPAVYGDKLSSVMEINMREGNREEFDGQLDLNFSGFGGVFEGPVSSKSSFLISARRSYLDLLVKALDVGTSIAPRYSDYQWKFVYNPDKNNKLSFLGLWGDDHSESDQKTAAENDMTAFGNQDYFENTTGLNWFALWGKAAYSNTSAAFTSTKFRETYYRTGPGTLVLNNNSVEQSAKLRNVTHYQLDKNNLIEAGTDIKFIFNRYENLYGSNEMTGVSENKMNGKFNEVKAGSGFSLISKISDDFAATFGLRADYFSFNEKINFSPRISFSYKIGERTSINGAAGYFRQNLPEILLSQSSNFKNLKTPAASHFILGADYLVTESTKLTLEIYDKEYSNFPVDPSAAEEFLIDETFTGDNFYGFHRELKSTGKARSYGIELTLQKKLASDFYGMASATYFRSKYNSGSGWHNRVFDNRFSVNIEGGYKPGNSWEFSLRWIYAGGIPYTPFNLSASEAANTGVYDLSKINSERYPDYHSLNIRFDKRFFFEKSNIVLYISIWNAYNRKNISEYYWNETENRKDEITQWLILPIFGIEYEF